MTDTDTRRSTGSASPPKPSPYEMTVDLNVIEHLGINLYSNIAAVLSEAVANAWDADAEHVANSLRMPSGYRLGLSTPSSSEDSPS